MLEFSAKLFSEGATEVVGITVVTEGFEDTSISFTLGDSLTLDTAGGLAGDDNKGVTVVRLGEFGAAVETETSFIIVSLSAEAARIEPATAEPAKTAPVVPRTGFNIDLGGIGMKLEGFGLNQDPDELREDDREG